MNERRRGAWALVLAAIVGLGLLSRSGAGWLPRIFAVYGGDTLYAAMVYAGLALLLPRLSVGRTAAVAGAMCLAIELSQLWHPPWLDALRRTRPGALALGHGFLWSDLACYATGVAGLAALEAATRRPPRSSPPPGR